LIDIKNTGKFIVPAILDPDVYEGKNSICATAFYAPAEMVDTWTKVTSKIVRFHQTGDGAEHSTLSEEQRSALKKSKGLITKYSYFGATGKKDLEWTLEQMIEKPTTWEEFVKKNEPLVSRTVMYMSLRLWFSKLHLSTVTRKEI
jgi:hypothetical protein